MKVAFLHIDIPGQDDARTMAEIMVHSVRQAMPSAEIVQLADEKTPMVVGVDTVIVRRMQAPWLMLYRLEHFKNLPEGDWMFIDTDAVVQRDVSGVFEKPFDVALTRRVGPIFVNGKDIVPDMPYNTGVMFSRNPAFWSDCYDYCASLPDKQKHWWGDQQAVRVVKESGKYQVRELTCDEYNYSPSSADEDVTGRYVVHYKGPIRKKMMLAKYAKEVA